MAGLAETGKFQSSQGRASASLSVVAVSLPWPCVKAICKFQAHMRSASLHTSITRAAANCRTRVTLQSRQLAFCCQCRGLQLIWQAISRGCAKSSWTWRAASTVGRRQLRIMPASRIADTVQGFTIIA